MYTYVYIYIYRERERDVYIYIYIYIYIYPAPDLVLRKHLLCGFFSRGVCLFTDTGISSILHEHVRGENKTRARSRLAEVQGCKPEFHAPHLGLN